MNSIRQHIAAFHSGPVPQTVEFGTTEELLAIPFVAQWNAETDGQPFYRFSISRDGKLLMAEYDQGRTHWVVGYLKSLTGVHLPTWMPPQEKSA